jgi:hypothetical protein
MENETIKASKHNGWEPRMRMTAQQARSTAYAIAKNEFIQGRPMTPQQIDELTARLLKDSGELS